MPADLQRVRSLFEEAMEMPTEQRAEWLRTLREEDPTTIERLKQLLHVSTENRSFLDTPAIARRAPEQHEHTQIGRYRVVRKLGAGGMGEVYLCRWDEGAQIRVGAMKLLRADVITPKIEVRFEEERTLLASLHDDNVARVLDGGVTEKGLPYLVMEYIEGEPIDSFVNRRRATLTQRLNLFSQVCSAVQYMHEHHVLHRDLKPANILVTQLGEVKVVDFGIAKQLGTSMEATATSMPWMTPGFASPEQMLMQKLTVASDVYSLGAVLYYLLTARRPLELTGKSLEQIIKYVRQARPLAMSEVLTSPRRAEGEFRIPISIAEWRDALRGDLDEVVATSLAAAPSGRYESVQAMEGDLRSVQANERISLHRAKWFPSFTKR